MDYSGKDATIDSQASNKVITRLRTFNQQSKITVQLSRLKSYESPLKKEYNIEKYDLSSNHVFPEPNSELIPKNTPLYVDKGENYVERIMRALHHFKQCALIGPSGTGKTHIVYLVAEIAGLPLWEINCGLQTTSFDLFGRYIGLGKENWVDGQIVSWCRHGGILYLDEANMMKQDVATRLNPLLDTRGHIVLNEKDNEIIPRHPLGFVIISMNPFSVEFSGTKPLNAAFRRRLSVWVNFDYLSVGSKISENEVQLIEKRGGVGRDVAMLMVRVAGQLRASYKKGDLPYAPSVGDLINWGTLTADGMDVQKAAEETIISTTSDEMATQEVVRRIIRAASGPALASQTQGAESLV
jgi:nitric oxide reductase NorQ protein